MKFNQNTIVFHSSFLSYLLFIHKKSTFYKLP